MITIEQYLDHTDFYIQSKYELQLTYHSPQKTFFHSHCFLAANWHQHNARHLLKFEKDLLLLRSGVNIKTSIHDLIH